MTTEDRDDRHSLSATAEGTKSSSERKGANRVSHHALRGATETGWARPWRNSTFPQEPLGKCRRGNGKVLAASRANPAGGLCG